MLQRFARVFKPRDVGLAPPGPHCRPFIGVLPEYRRDPLNLFSSLARYGDIVKTRIGPFPTIFINHPDYIKHVLVDNVENYHKGVAYSRLKALIGEGLVTSNGDTWKRNRKLLQAAFNRKNLSGHASLIYDGSQALLERWRAKELQPLNVFQEMLQVTLDNICNVILGIKLGPERDVVLPSFLVATNEIKMRLGSLMPFHVPLPTARQRRFKEALTDLDRIIFRFIAERRRLRSEGSDLLSTLLQVKDPDTGASMSDLEVRDEMITFLLAGHETSADALTWTLYCLSQHPRIEQKVREEVRRVTASAPLADTFPNLHYTTAVIEESMRIYPPAWNFAREALADDSINGYAVKAGSLMEICPYTLHRHPVFWSDPEAFDPDRFLPERKATRPRYAYIPFGGGRRLCIAIEFAMMEIKCVLAAIIARYHLELQPGFRVGLEPSITLQPRNGMMMTLHPVT
jgi:cytochrome P450